MKEEEEWEGRGQEEKQSQMKCTPLLLTMSLSMVWLLGRLGNEYNQTFTVALPSPQS